MKKNALFLSILIFIVLLTAGCVAGRAGDDGAIPELSWCEIPVDAESLKPADKNSIYIYFGVYPQTVLAKDSGVVVDETDSVTVGANVYFRGSDGEYYARAEEKPYNFNRYSDGSCPSRNGRRYFRVEPIKWKVLTVDYNGSGRALLLAENSLMAGIPYFDYNASSLLRKVGSTKNIPANSYKYSQIRAWLNGQVFYSDRKESVYRDRGFLQTAFTKRGRSCIKTTCVDNSAQSTSDSGKNIPQAKHNLSPNTRDKIFLLSEMEVTAEEFGFDGYDAHSADSPRLRFPSDWAMAHFQGQSPSEGSAAYWWLRSPYYADSYSARFVFHDGNAGDTYLVKDPRVGVVPALVVE